ncbi:MAG: hypothetical protein QXK37_06335, partial [Candidatus Woesearchaeota archaeon]
MQPLLSKQNKGMYELVTTFLFILIVVFMVVAIIYIGCIIKTKRVQINNELVQYNYIMDAKNRLLSNECYGQTLNEVATNGTMSVNETCPFNKGIIKGYIIEMPKYQNCSSQNKQWNHSFEGEIFQEAKQAYLV